MWCRKRSAPHFGPAILGTGSPRYMDRAELFTGEQMRDLCLARADLPRRLSRRYRLIGEKE